MMMRYHVCMHMREELLVLLVILALYLS